MRLRSAPLHLLSGAARAAALGLLSLPLCALPAPAEPLRIATFSPDLGRRGPGLLYRDMLGGKDAQIAAVVAVIARADPDLLLLTGIDWDYDNLALKELARLLSAAGAGYPHHYASRPNSGMDSGLDLDQNGRLGTADDAQGFGFFTGQDGMAVLSRHPLGPVTDYSAFLWRDLEGNLMPPAPPEITAAQRLSSVAHWDLPVEIAGRSLHLLAYSATPPVFDGPEDRNGRRNHDETAFWRDRLPEAPFVLLGNANLDINDSEGRPEALAALLSTLQDPLPQSAGGKAYPQNGANSRHKGDPALDTANWPAADGPGNMRVDYVLPAQGLRILDAGVLWPDPQDDFAKTVEAASRHRLVWVDLDWPPTTAPTTELKTEEENGPEGGVKKMPPLPETADGGGTGKGRAAVP